MPKFLRILDIVLLLTCAALLLVDLQIKNELVARAKQWEEKLNEQGRPESVDHIHSGVPGDIPDGDVFLDSPMETASATANGSGANRARKRSSAAANRGTGNPDSGIPFPSESVGP